MATDIVGSLFGVTPEQLEMARRAEMQKSAMGFAQLTPEQQVNYGAALAGQQLGRAVGGLLGAEDPEMRLVRLRSGIMQGTDPTNIESLTGAIQKLQSAGDTVGALNLTNILRNLQKTQAETIKVTKEGLTTEQRNAAGLADSLHQRGTPEWASTYKTELTRLTSKESPKGQIKEVGVAIGTQQPVYLDPNTDQQYIYIKGQDGKQARQPYFGGVDITRSKTQVSVTQQGQEEFMKQLGKIDANKVQDAMNARETSIATLNSLNRLNQLNQDQLISGSFASGRVGATNLLNTLGLISGKDVDRLSSSENYQKIAGDVILGTLGGKLGAGFSNEDRKFIQSLVPQLENSAYARKQLIEYMVRKNNEIVNEATRLETYARDNMSLKGYTPQIPIVNIGTPGSDLRSMSTEELKKRLNQ